MPEETANSATMNDSSNPPQRRLPLDAIQKALTSNQNLQEQIRSEIEKIRSLKAKNRKRAAALSLSLPTTATSTTQEQQQLPNCAWKNEYFMESTKPKSKSVPEPNEDAVRRKKAEDESFFARTEPSWQKKDIEQLLKLVAEVTSNGGSEEDAGGGDTRDFDDRSSALPEESIDFTKIAANLSTKTVRRTADQCRIQYRNVQMKKRNKQDAAWTAKEIESLRKLIEEQQQKQKGHDGTNSDAPAINWKQVAETLGTNRTPWELLQTYFAKIVGRPKTVVWTPEEDEVMLKYTAAMGPQVLIDGAFVSDLAARFLPDKTPKQIFARINHSLVNPNLKNEAWVEDDERKLALCMKVYSESPSSAVYLASGHLPWRSPMTVMSKWERSLNPAFSTGPFSKTEDQELLKVMRQNPKMGFKEIATMFFPHRHPQRLMNRWSEMATDKDILDRCGDQLVKEGQGAGEGNRGELDASEYVVQVKKVRRS